MKIFVPKINESWIVDRVREEWYKNNKDISTKLRNKSDVIWIMAPWLLKSKRLNQLETKVLAHIIILILMTLKSLNLKK